MSSPDADPNAAVPPSPPPSRRFRARDAVVAIVVCAVLLVLIAGASVKRQGKELSPGTQHDIVAAVGKPTSAIADALPLAKTNHKLTGFLSPDGDLGSSEGAAIVSGGGVTAVTPDAFDPTMLGQRRAAPQPLQSLLVTGDSMSQPLDNDIARSLAPKGVKVTRDPHIGSGISKTDLVDWRALARQQAAKKDQAVVVFIGANEGFPLPDASGREQNCCGAGWAAAYATRARQMMDAYRRAGASRVYWLLLPMPREQARQEISRAVNAAVRVAAAPYAAQVRILDMSAVFTPKGYRDAMTVDGKDQIVRDPDGIHLNDTGSKLAAKLVLRDVAGDYKY